MHEANHPTESFDSIDPTDPTDPIGPIDADPNYYKPAITTSLTPQQVRAANMLAVGLSYSEISMNLSIGRTTLYRWRELPEFIAYMNILFRQTADEVTLQSTYLLAAALKLIKDRINDPNTPHNERIRLAFRLMHLYTRPGFLKFLSNRSDCPREIQHKQISDSMRHAGGHATKSTLSDPNFREGYLRNRHDLLNLAVDFDAKYPYPANIPLSQPQPPAAVDPATPARTKMKQNETSKQRSTAIDQALTGIREKVAAAQ